MKKKFDNIELKSPLFYNSPIALRFDLEGNFFQDSGNVKEVLRKALVLFNFLNNHNEELFVVSFVDNWEEDSTVSDFEEGLLKVFNKVIKSENECTINKNEQDYRYRDDDDDDDVVTYCYWIKVKVEDLDIENLLKEKLFSTLNEEEYNSIGDLYLINSSKDTIYHMYDERGLDIVSTKKETLMDMYIEYNGWILEHDRKYIDEIFKD